MSSYEPEALEKVSQLMELAKQSEDLCHASLEMVKAQPDVDFSSDSSSSDFSISDENDTSDVDTTGTTSPLLYFLMKIT